MDIGLEHRIVKDREVASINKKYGSHHNVNYFRKSCHNMFHGLCTPTKDIQHQKLNPVTGSSMDLNEAMIMHIEKSDLLSNT